jgi:hypothetical protein
VQAVTRTAVMHVANASRSAWFEENSDIIEAERFVATLDSRTTPICRAEDGNQYELGKGPVPPLHFQCRSLRIAAIDGVLAGDRPAKPYVEKELAQEYAKENGYDGVKKRDDLPHGTKGDFDKWKRKRIRELVGPVPASTTYQEWMKNQSATFQDDTLGVTKAKLFREGLPLDKFVNRAGDELTLKQLAETEANAFRAAGLDPSSYIRATVSKPPAMSMSVASSQITDDEKWHIKSYQRGAEINNHLRVLQDNDSLPFQRTVAQQRLEQPDVAAQLAALDRTTRLGAFEADTVLYRGVNSKLLNLPGNGKEFVDPAFVATSADPAIGAAFGEMLIIKVPKGATALDVNAALGDQTLYASQKEFILPRNSRFRVVVNEDGSRVLELVQD